MAFRPLERVQAWWATATPKQQRTWMVLAIGVVILTAAFLASQFAPKTRARPQDKRTESTVMLPQRKDLSAESLQSQMTSLQNQVRDIMAYLRSVDNNVKTANDNISAKIDQKLEDVVSSKTLQEKIERAVEGKVLESNERNRASGAVGGGGGGARMPAGAGAPDATAPLPNYSPAGPVLPGIGAPGAAPPPDAAPGTATPGAAVEPKDDAGVGQMRIGGRPTSGRAGAGAGATSTGATMVPGAPAAGGAPGSTTAVTGDPGRVNPATHGGVQLGKAGRPGTGGGIGTVTRPADNVVGGTAVGTVNETARDFEDRNQGGESLHLTAGAIFSGVLLNGMDAPTSQVAQKNPTPVVIRLKSLAILPNRYRADVRECFVLAGGYGVLSTERANMRTETFTCIMNNGKVFESKLDGYIVGEDGKVGMRGRLVTKQGAAIANAMIAGILSGIGNAMAQGTANATNIASGGFFYSTANAQEVLQNGAYQGVGQALNTVAKFYTDMAKEMFPVVEIDAGRNATIMLIKGISLKAKV